MSEKPNIDLTNVITAEYVCPRCRQTLTLHDMFPKQPLAGSMYCPNKLCPIKRIKIFTVG